MLENEKVVTDQGVLETIASLQDERVSGSLEIGAGATKGTILFKHGKLVEARMGHLSGFQAVNAIASIRDASFHFDPSVAPPASSSISSSERLVLKQFFGIETLDSNEYSVPVSAAEVDEATVVTPELTSVPAPLLASHPGRSWTPYLTALALGVVVIAIVAAAVLLRQKFRERAAAPSVATVESVEPARIEPRVEPVKPSEPQPAPIATETKVEEKRTPAPVAQKETVAQKQPATIPDLTGTWNVVNTVRNTSFRSFENMQVGFMLSITQTGTTFTAKGQKISENGRSLPAGSRTSIQVNGFINGDNVEATFVEAGALRKSNGRFVWKLSRAGGLTGTFASTAARTSGKSTAKRDT